MLRFAPQYHVATWGGRRLATEMGRAIPDGPVGESWELVELPNHESVVVAGPLQGQTLGALWRDGKLGGSARGPFPFLLKWLDTTAWLSVQVHPDEAGCERMGKGDPKTEAWYVAYADAGAPLLLGHYPGLDDATLRQAATRGTLEKWLYELHPRVGDMLMVRAGTLHAIGAGFLILEVQQPSKTTYRVYDWGRVGLDGNPRELHVDDAVGSVCFDQPGTQVPARDRVVGPRFSMTACSGEITLEVGPLRVITATGDVVMKHGSNTTKLKFGDVAVAEPSDGNVAVNGPFVALSEN